MLAEIADQLRAAGWNHDDPWGAVLRFVLVLCVAFACAWASGPLGRRWLRSRHGEPAGDDAGAVLRALRGLVASLGLYEAFRSLQLAGYIAAFAENALFVFAVLLAAILVIRSAALAFRRYLERTADGAQRERAQREYLPLASTTITVGVTLLAVILLAHHFGHDVSSLVAAFGVGSLAIGLAAQATLGNTIAGFILLVDRPFRPGDRIRLQSGESGAIQEIGIRSTRILVPEGNLLIVPNAELANSRVLNLSLPREVTHAEVRAKVALAAVESVCALWLELAAGDPSVAAVAAVAAAGDAGPPSTAVTALDGRTAEVALRFATPTAERGPAEDRLRRALASRLSPEQLP